MPKRAPTLLVIEDARDQAVLVGIAAGRAHPGLEVRIANNGIEGVSYLAGMPPFEDRKANPRPDLILLDLLMPEVDGFAVLKWIGKRPALLSIPVVVLTSSPRPDHETRARALGARAVYRKPCDLGELDEVVREIVQGWIARSTMIAAHIWAAG